MVGETTGTREVPDQNDQGEEEIRASGDALVVADAIYAGLKLLADSVDRLTKSLEGEETDDRQGEFYLDGTPR